MKEQFAVVAPVFENECIPQDILLIKNIATQYPEVYEDELQDWLQYLTGRIFSLSSIRKCLSKMGWSRREASKPFLHIRGMRYCVLDSVEEWQILKVINLSLLMSHPKMREHFRPYSPDMNPIEEAFGCAKQWLQRHKDVCIKYPKWCFEIALDQVTECKSYHQVVIVFSSVF
ncbi:hypothetical protein QZH41_011927 [Actinostola sp. cb2023]|nr:hypothetical protein QZH41_011927 [Actinostola sp. cb2023]